MKKVLSIVLVFIFLVTPNSIFALDESNSGSLINDYEPGWSPIGGADYPMWQLVDITW